MIGMTIENKACTMRI